MAAVYFTAQSRKIFDNIKETKTRNKIIQGLRKLSQNPCAGKKLRGKLKGTYSLKIWPYRILYEFTPRKDMIVTDIGHRKEVYR